MKTPKHTPGPWNIVKTAPQGKSRIDIKAGRLCLIARIFHGASMYEGNASLIASAPTLYDACTSALRLILEEPGTDREATIAQLLSALAKATGGDE